MWRLDVPEQEINRIFKTYEKFKYRSFKLMSDMIRFLTKELNFTKQKILQQSYLFQVNPQYPKQHFNLFPTIAGTDIKYILHKYPKLIAVPPESIAKIISHLKVYFRYFIPFKCNKNMFLVVRCTRRIVKKLLRNIHIMPRHSFIPFKSNKKYTRIPSAQKK